MTAWNAPPSSRELGAPELAGYRVLRSLARDERAEVLLGHRSTVQSRVDETDAAAQTVAQVGAQIGAQTVALKVFPATEVGWQAAIHECGALERARGDHVVDLLDLDADDDSIRLVFERLPRGDLAELLRIRLKFDAGEAVTLLAPIAATILRLHGGGVAHGNLSARTVLFRDDGSPTLIGFSQAAMFEPHAPEVVLEQVEAVRRDRTSIRTMALTVLARVNGDRVRSARRLHDDIEGCADELVVPLLASRLFEVAAATAVRFAPDEPDVDAASSTPRAVPLGAAVVESSAPSGGAARSWIAGLLSRVVPEALLQRVLVAVEHSPAAPAAAAATRLWRSWTPARRRIAIAVAAVGLTVAVVTAVIPPP
ncbi:MAG TPA: protein kinase, partial [Pseudolysinimonas sp.]